MCLNKQDSEYASGPNNAKILIMAGFSICERYTAFWIHQNMPWQSTSWVANMSGFWMWQVFEYARVIQGSRYATIWLNMSEVTIIVRVLNIYHTIHSATSLYKLLSSKMERFGKITIAFNYFHKNSILNLWENSEYVSGFKYVRVLNIRKFS